MEKLKVAIITSGYFPVPPVKGGAIETLVNMLYEENALKKNVELTVYSMYDETAKRETINTTNNKIKYIKIPLVVKGLDIIAYLFFKKILRVKKHMSYRYIFQRLYYLGRVSESISHISYDKLVLENHPTMLGVLKKHRNYKQYKGKYYYHAHNEIYRTFGYDKYLEDAEGFLCVSKYIGNTIHKLMPNYPETKIKVLRNRVDEIKFRNLNEEKLLGFKRKYKIPENHMIFTFTGRLNPEKGVKELLNAYKMANPKNSKLVIAGSYYFGSGIKSEYEKELVEIAEDIKDEIVFTGNIDYEDMPYMYAASDVIILPSIWNDPAPLTVIESITCGKPLITTYSGGIPEYANESNAIILRIDDNLVKNMANAIQTLSFNIEKRNELIERAKLISQEWKKSDYYLDFISLIKNDDED